MSRAITNEEADLMVSYMEDPSRSQVPKFHRDRAIVYLSTLLGFRANETRRLQWAHVLNYRTGKILDYIVVERNLLKGGNRDNTKVRSRKVAIDDLSRSILFRYCQEYKHMYEINDELPQSNLYLFRSVRKDYNENKPISNHTLRRAIQEMFVLACPDSDETLISSHSLRKRYCQVLYELSGYDLNTVRLHVGHALINTTQKYLEANTLSEKHKNIALGRHF